MIEPTDEMVDLLVEAAKAYGDWSPVELWDRMRSALVDALADEACQYLCPRCGVEVERDVLEDTGHHYLSTGCLHGEHGYCQSSTGAAGAKTPAQCKFCAAPCMCSCHGEAS